MSALPLVSVTAWAEIEADLDAARVALLATGPASRVVSWPLFAASVEAARAAKCAAGAANKHNK